VIFTNGVQRYKFFLSNKHYGQFILKKVQILGFTETEVQNI